jgi:hypothetical protein
MTQDVFSDTYWTNEFEVTEADLDRIASYIDRTSQASDLTALAGRVVCGRLEHGPETSAPVQPTWVEDASVRLWDPAGEWETGDHVIVARRIPKTQLFEALIGEIIGLDSEQVGVQLDTVDEPVTYQRAPAESDTARRWHAKVQEVVNRKRTASGLGDQAEAILLTHGERIGSQLLEALLADERFIRLAGHWFLSELAMLATKEQLTALVWALARLTEPKPTAELVPLVHPPLVDGDSGLFGLYLAMRQRDDLFKNTDPGQRPRWVLAGPPPGPFTPRYAAYDPDTYEVLCMPGATASPEVARQLWDLQLLQAVV